MQVGASWNGSGEEPWMRLKQLPSVSTCGVKPLVENEMNAEFLRIDFFRVLCLASEHFVAASAHASHPIVSRLLAKASTPYNLEAQDRVMQSRPGRLTC